MGKLSTKGKRLIKGKTKETIYRTGPTCIPKKKNCSEQIDKNKQGAGMGDGKAE